MKLGKSGIEEVERSNGQEFASPYFPDVTQSFGFERDSVQPAGRGPSERSMQGAFDIPSLEVDPRGGVALYQAWANMGEAVSEAGKALNNIALREEAFLTELDHSDYNSRQASWQKQQAIIQEESEKKQLAGEPTKEIEAWAKSQWEDFKTRTTEQEFIFKDTQTKWNDYLDSAGAEFNLKFFKNFTEPAYIRETQQKDQQTMLDLLDTATMAGKKMEVEPMLKAMQWAEEYKNDPRKAVLDANIVAKMDKFKKDLLTAWAEGAVDTNPFRVNQILGGLAQSVPPHLLEGIKEKVERAQEIAINKAERAAGKRATKFNAEIEDRIIGNKLTHEEIDQLPIDASSKFKAHKKLDEWDLYKAEAKTGRQYWATDGQLGLKYGQNLTEKENKWLEIHNEDFMSDISVLPIGQRPKAIAEHYNKIGHMPESMVSSMRAAINGDNPEAVKAATATIQTIRQESPYLYNKYFKDDGATIAQIEGGVPIETIKKNRITAATTDPKVWDDSVKAMYKERETLYEEDMKKAYGTNVSIDPGKKSEYEDSLKRNLSLVGGNQEMARRLTVEEMKRRYSYTNVDGTGRLTKHAPEMYYGNPYEPGENKWMRHQLDQEALRKGVDLVDKQILVEVDPGSVKAGKPTYIISTMEDGVINPVFKGWYPDKQSYATANPGFWEQMGAMMPWSESKSEKMTTEEAIRKAAEEREKQKR